MCVCVCVCVCVNLCECVCAIKLMGTVKANMNIAKRQSTAH